MRWGFALIFFISGLMSGVAQGARYEIEPFARVRFVVEGPLDDVEGLTRSVAGELTLEPERWAEGSASLAVELRSLRTGIDKRDEDMREHFLETSRFPRVLLQIMRVENASARSLTPGQSVEGEAMGAFELHGHRRSVRFHVRVQENADGRLDVFGGFPVVLADYGIERPERLFLKLGAVAQVSFEASFRVSPAAPERPAVAALQPTVKELLPALPPPPRQSRPPPAPLASTALFKGDSPAAKGERLFHSPAIGGSGNTLSCDHCHASADERKGLVQSDGHVRSAHSLYDVAQRPHFWGGFSDNLPRAIQLCAKLNLRQPDGLPASVVDGLTAFLTALSPDPAPELDYRVLYRTFESPLPRPEDGDVARGRSLAFRYCMTCHLTGRTAPLLLPGLYEASWLVRRLRRMEGHQNRQEPPFAIDRLPDSELRDIVTWLTHAPPVFPARHARVE